MDEGLAGWGTIGDVKPGTLSWISSGGNPDGFIQVQDAASGNRWWWVAPIKFLDDKSAYYTGSLQFDIMHTGGGGLFADPCDVELHGANNMVVCRKIWPDGPKKDEWVTVDVPLEETGWLFKDTTTEPTGVQMEEILKELTVLRIRGEFITGKDIGSLDNVRIFIPGVKTDLSIAITESEDPILPDQELIYTISVTNLSAATATNLTVEATITPLLNNQSISCPCTRATLDPGDTWEFNIGGIPEATTDGVTTINATVSSSLPDPSLANNKATENTFAGWPEVDLAIQITEEVPIWPDPNLIYTIKVSILGSSPGDTAHNVEVSTPALTGLNSSSPDCTCELLGVLNKGTSWVFDIKGTIVFNGADVVIRAAVKSSYQEPFSTLQNNESTLFTKIGGRKSDLSISITENADQVGPGELLTYTVTVTNSEFSAATNAEVVVTTTPPLTDPSPSCTMADPCSMQLGTGDTWAFDIEGTVAVPHGVTTIETWVETATLTILDPNMSNNHAVEVTSVDPLIPWWRNWRNPWVGGSAVLVAVVLIVLSFFLTRRARARAIRPGHIS